MQQVLTGCLCCATQFHCCAIQFHLHIASRSLSESVACLLSNINSRKKKENVSRELASKNILSLALYLTIVDATIIFQFQSISLAIIFALNICDLR